jgi:hypothetical protein
MNLVLTLLCFIHVMPVMPQGHSRQASVALMASTDRVVLLEIEGEPGPCEACTPTTKPIELMTVTNGPRRGKLGYSYSVTGGKLLGEGAHVKWDLSGVKAGAYTVSVKVRDRYGNSRTASSKVTVEICTCIREAFPPLEPPVDVGRA